MDTPFSSPLLHKGRAEGGVHTILYCIFSRAIIPYIDNLAIILGRHPLRGYTRAKMRVIHVEHIYFPGFKRHG